MILQANWLAKKDKKKKKRKTNALIPDEQSMPSLLIKLEKIRINSFIWKTYLNGELGAVCGLTQLR